MIHALLASQLAFLLVFGYPVENDANIVRVKDLDAAETFWSNSHTGGRGYSGWGTGVSQQAAQPPNYAYATYAGYGDNGYYGGGNYGAYGNYGGNYVGRYPVYASYVSQQPTYENYGLHGGHGFGKYGKY